MFSRLLRFHIQVACLGAALAFTAERLPAAELDTRPTPQVDFARDIRPILARHCWSCHGPDEKSRQADLRLDQREAAVAAGAVAPGDPSASELIARIESLDESQQMPPPEAKKPLSAPQKELLRTWINQGAEFRQHWAFALPRRPAVPDVQNTAWPQNEIDRFVLHRLEQEGLAPSPEADRAALLRRVTLDLTGLPPTLEELDAFLSDASPEAYSRVVDRLLASPRYAERMAMAWLDAARYADTNGYNNDEDRSMWPWRDWVIDAFRRNQPYDEFIVEQLAGDLLPAPTLAQKVATGFHRNQGHNTEGGIIAEEYRVEYVADRVHTTATVFLGLSLQCARCHDHKYDPFSTQDYYRFFAFFNDLDEKQAPYGNFFAAEPYLRVPSAEQQAQLATLADRHKQLTEQLATREAEGPQLFARWEQAATADEKRMISSGDLALSCALDESAGDAVDDASHPSQPGVVKGHSRWTTGKQDGALEFDGQTHVDLGNRGDFDGTKGFSIGVWVYSPSGETVAVLSKMDEANAYRGYDLLLDGGNRPACHIIHRWPDNGIKIVALQPFSPETWHHLLIAYDGSRKAAGVRLFVDGKVQPFRVESDSLSDTIATDQPLRLGRRQTSLSFSGKLDDVRFFEQELTPEQAEQLAAGQVVTLANDLLAVPPTERSAEQQAKLARLYLERVDQEYPRLKGELAEADRQRKAVEESLPAVMVMQEAAARRETFVLVRGAYDQPGEKVEPDAPAALSPLPAGAPRNRLGLARWLVDPANPLTARVAVNRWWQTYFGTGLVKTAEDFGATGETPSDPDLLDFLATELISSGWDVRAMQRRIVLSATYRQASRVTPALAERDPENRLLARGPRVRLSAETIRDNALAVCGLLAERLGGPSVKPYQPEGLWEDVSVERRAKYVADTGDGLYRRSMYTFWKRTCPPPALMSFDATNREVCIVRRGRTNTPLQALVLLNDPTYIEAARKLAERVLVEDATSEDRLRLACRLVLAREPETEEQEALLTIYAQALAGYSRDPAAAGKLLAVGASPCKAGLDHVQLAAWTVVCSTILNLDEAITKR
jgi:hypothetical protein